MLLGSLLGLWTPSSKSPECPSRIKCMITIRLVILPLILRKVLCQVMPGTEDKIVSCGIRNTYLVFVPGSRHRAPKCHSFLNDRSDRSVFYSDEATLSRPLDSFRMKVWSSERLRHDWRFGTYILTSPLLGRRERLETELITNGQWFNQSYICTEVSIET